MTGELPSRMMVKMKRLRERRKARGMTQAEVAMAAGVTRTSVVHIERGDSTPSLPLALSLANVLGTTVEDLVG